MRNIIMTPEFTDKLTECLQVWVKIKYKAINYTETYSRHLLLEFVKDFTDWLMFLHCVEDREAMTRRDKQDFADWMENAIIDKKANEEQEYRDSLDKSSNNGK